tara:strand:- start:1 stop:594 length:594 start_codon:yes stop_codon:yes gene_type:complete
MKSLFLIRHGIAQHNILFQNIGKKIFYDPRYYDTRLTPQGHEQSLLLGSTWDKLHTIDLVLCSSLYRSLETAENIFLNTNTNILALDCLKEFPQGLQTCNKRSPKSELIQRFHKINFSHINTENDELWNDHKEESIDSLNQRIQELNDFIKGRKENNIAIISHNSFIGQYKNNKINLIENGDKELLHCSPYEFQLKL